MTAPTTWPWAALALLGAVHGLNPGMGWLFAVALGLQERDRRAVWSAMLPLAVGHALAIAAAIGVAAVVGLVVATDGIRWIVAATLLVLGVVRLRRHRHPRWVGMRAGARDLTLWSFLMATAHGAGLMLLPFALGICMADAATALAPGIPTASTRAVSLPEAWFWSWAKQGESVDTKRQNNPRKRRNICAPRLLLLPILSTAIP